MSTKREGSGANHRHHYTHRVDVEGADERAERQARESQRQIEKLQHENAALRSVVSTIVHVGQPYANNTGNSKPRPSAVNWHTQSIDRTTKK